MKKHEQIIQFMINVIFSNIFKLVLAFVMLSVLSYFALFLGPLLGSAIGMLFILIFGEGSYLEVIIWFSTICMFLCYTYLTITLVWSDEIKAYRVRKEHQKEQILQSMFKDIVVEMKQNAKNKGLENDKIVQDCISAIEGFTIDNRQKE